MEKHRNVTAELASIAMQLGWYGGSALPVALVGVPGTAKTQFSKGLARKLGEYLKEKGISEKYGYFNLVAPQAAPEDVGGIPFMDTGAETVHYVERKPLKGVYELHTTEYGLFFVDELTSSNPAVGATLMTAVQDGKFGDTTLTAKVGRMAAMNPAECAAAGRDLSAPEVNRWMVLEWDLPDADFLDFITGGEGLLSHVLFLDEDWEQRNLAQSRALFSTYLKKNPKWINGMRSGATTAKAASDPWPSQRQWWNAIRMGAALLSLGIEPSSDHWYLMLMGLVGEGPAEQFVGFLRDLDLPNPEDVIAEAMKEVKNESEDDRDKRILNVIGSTVLRRTDKTNLALTAIAYAACDKTFPDIVERYNAAWTVLGVVLDIKPDAATEAAMHLANLRHPGIKVPDTAAKLFQIRAEGGIGTGARVARVAPKRRKRVKP